MCMCCRELAGNLGPDCGWRSFSDGVVGVALGVPRGEVGLLHPAKRILLVAGDVAIRIGDAGQVVLVVVGVLGHVLGRIRYRN